MYFTPYTAENLRIPVLSVFLFYLCLQIIDNSIFILKFSPFFSLTDLFENLSWYVPNPHQKEVESQWFLNCPVSLWYHLIITYHSRITTSAHAQN